MTSSPASRPRPAGPGRRSRGWLLLAMCTTVVAIAFEVMAVNTAMPAAMRDLDALSFYAWAFSGFLVGSVFATVVSGRLSDRLGPRSPLAVGLVLFVAGLLTAGLAGSIAQLVLGRVVQGLGSGFVNTALFVVIARVYPDRERARVYTFVSSAWLMPAFVGPPVSAWLTETWSWHWAFLAAVPVAVAGGSLLLGILRGLPLGATADPARAGARASWWVAAVMSASVAAVQLAGQLAGQRLDLVSLGLLAAGVVGLGYGLPRVMPRGFLRLGRGLPAVVLVRGLLPGAFFGAEAFLPLMLVELRGLGLAPAGATLTIGAVGWSLGAWLQSRVWLPVPRDRFITLGCLCVAAGVGAIAVAAAWAAVWVGVVAGGWVVAGLGMGLAMASTNVAGMSLASSGTQGRTGSALALGEALGAAVFIGLCGTLFAGLQAGGALTAGFVSLLLAMSGVAMVGAAASLRIGRVPNPAREAPSRTGAAT